MTHPECLHATANASDDYSGVECCLCNRPCEEVSFQQQHDHDRWQDEVMDGAA